jgi:hypothetical protein
MISDEDGKRDCTVLLNVVLFFADGLLKLVVTECAFLDQGRRACARVRGRGPNDRSGERAAIQNNSACGAS